jgi:H+/Cl- antiporter ClcA
MPEHRRLGDFTTDSRVLFIAAVAVLVATAGVAVGFVLLKLIYLCTNIAYFGEFSLAHLHIEDHKLGLWAVLVPVAGSLVVGLMARFGSEKIRGHGIPEAIEAILLGRSKLSLKVAILKPLSSAIAIGTGGPFGAEGPIIMTGGAVGSLFAQILPVSDNERKTLLVAGAAAGMTTVFGTPIAGHHIQWIGSFSNQSSMPYTMRVVHTLTTPMSAPSSTYRNSAIAPGAASAGIWNTGVVPCSR